MEILRIHVCLHPGGDTWSGSIWAINDSGRTVVHGGSSGLLFMEEEDVTPSDVIPQKQQEGFERFGTVEIDYPKLLAAGVDLRLAVWIIREVIFRNTERMEADLDSDQYRPVLEGIARMEGVAPNVMAAREVAKSWLDNNPVVASLPALSGGRGCYF